ncbi:MAG TPA: SAM-dependent methyltransferase [Amycolatopsis sp.]|uniref:SAM-dependent methyltransferase n=1 Tax=Amycolatopsis sp. TaxID=37632 RepID=UPI002B480474|nr:SAM-dependent methyltransferase [Amycolatopsis sp.]HKS46478.1 SAM-dependent methyltransferase [Amycolatopsis sp.]
MWRVYDWLLGGTSNWAVDRAFGARVVDAFPLLKSAARANRLFLHRAVRHPVGLGVRQFIDIGSGIPTMGNTHEIAEQVAPDSRVVYVDNEPVAVAHSQVLLERHGDVERHAVVRGDMREPHELWHRIQETRVIDFSEPVALLLVALLHIRQPGRNGTDIGPRAVEEYRQLLPSGSHLVISRITDEGVPPDLDEKLVELKRMYDTSSGPMIWRSHQQIRDLLGDFTLMEPGMTRTPLWHPEDSGPAAPKIAFDTPEQSTVWAGVGRKP